MNKIWKKWIKKYKTHHYINRGEFKMKKNKENKDILWDLFKKTGDIKYYNLMKQIKKKWLNDNRKFWRNNNKWNKL